MIHWPFTRAKVDDDTRSLYEAIVAQARQPAFYLDLGVADTVEGRFDMIVLHVFLIAQRLKAQGDEGERLSQLLLEALFDDMDASLREMGVGDMGVPKRIRKMAEACFGRMQAYDEAFIADDGKLKDAVARNVYTDRTADPDNAGRIADYMVRSAAKLAKQNFDELSWGNAVFPAIEDEESAS